VAGFNCLTDLGDAIETADKAMYAQRNQVRGVYEARLRRTTGTGIKTETKAGLETDLICS